MSIPVAGRLSDLDDSPTLAVGARAAALKAAGVDVLSLAMGEPDFDTPPHVRQAAAAAAEAGETRYTPATGSARLRKAVARRHADRDGVVYEADEVLIASGAKHALYGLFQALLEPGDAVLLPAPYWVSYPAQIGLAGATTFAVPTDPAAGFVPQREALREGAARARAAGRRPRAIVLNSPCNPTGAAYPRAALEALVEEALSLSLVIVSDEIYGRLVYGGFAHVSVPSLSDEARRATFLVDGVSKTYAMTGWRVGWLCGDREVVGAAGRLQSQSTSGPCSVSQAAALAALEGPHDFLAGWVAAYDERRRALVEGLNALGRTHGRPGAPALLCPEPQGAFYVFPAIGGLLGRPGGPDSDADLALWLLEAAGVATVPGTPFGAPGHLRLSYATSLPRCREALARMDAAFSRLPPA